MRTTTVLATVGFIVFGQTAAALAYTDFGQGRPITARDIAGKSFCWSAGGTKANYANDGQYTDNRGRHGQWSISEPGVLRIGNWHMQVEVLSDGRLHQWRYCLLCTWHDFDSWGNQCR
jgi:hypothetical protein